jgi:nucleoid-associated protein YgaU
MSQMPPVQPEQPQVREAAAVPPAGEPGTAGGQGQETINRTSAVPPVEPTTIAQGRQAPRGPDAALIGEVESMGGQVVQDPNGNSEIRLPEAVRTVPRKSPSPQVHATNEKLATSTQGDAPVMTEPMKVHAVKQGETLFQISSKYYGTGHLWRELAKYNGVSDKAGQVRVGAQLKIPGRETLTGRPAPQQRATTTPPAAPPAPGKKPAPGETRPGRIEVATYTVKRGDTLGEISQKVLGTSRRWQEIAKLNKLDDEDSIAAGMVLKVPAMRG